MTQIQLSQDTTSKITAALQGVGDQNINYLNAYNAIYNEIKDSASVDAGTKYWFSGAGFVNQYLFDSNPTGAYIHDYLFAASAFQGATLQSRNGRPHRTQLHCKCSLICSWAYLTRICFLQQK